MRKDIKRKDIKQKKQKEPTDKQIREVIIKADSKLGTAEAPYTLSNKYYKK